MATWETTPPPCDLPGRCDSSWRSSFEKIETWRGDLVSEEGGGGGERERERERERVEERRPFNNGYY